MLTRIDYPYGSEESRAVVRAAAVTQLP